VPCDARSTGWRGETRCARSRELRSDNRRENDGRCALRAPPVPLRFSAAHKARLRRTARTFADAVAVFVNNGPVFDACTTNAARAAVGGGAQWGPSTPSAPDGAPGARAPGRPGRTGRVRAGKRGDFGGAEQRSVGVGARSALRTSDLRRCV